MITLDNLEEILSELKFETLDDMINCIYDKLKLSIAIFDAEGVLQGICMHANRCKCYYVLLHGKQNQCSIFDPGFSATILAEKEVDKLCDFACRVTSRTVEICEKPHKIIIYQYNLDDDSLEFSPQDKQLTPAYKGDPSGAEYF
jgi:hypothetical protein